MTDHMTGGCQCGLVRFSSSQKPVAVRTCWCRDCQFIATGNASVSAFFRTSGFSIQGKTTSFSRKADSGRVIRQHFCPTCGTPIFADDEADNRFVAVRVGALDDREIGAPESTIWTTSAPSWANVDHKMASWPTHPSI